MNIFFVDKNPVIAAQMLCNAHVRSQIKESCQMLSTAHYILGLDDPRMEPPTHKHHPCTKWIMERDQNYKWLYRHLEGLLDEYKFRHGVPNQREHMREVLATVPDGIEYSYGGITPPPAVVSPDLKPRLLIPEHVISAYRAYYNREKRHLHHWMVREKPNWILDDAQFAEIMKNKDN